MNQGPPGGGGGGSSGGSDDSGTGDDSNNENSDFLSNPESFVKGVIRNFLAQRLIQGIVTVASFVVTAIYRPFEIGADTIIELADILVDGTAPAGQAVLDAIEGVNQSAAAAAASAGLAAPVVVWVLQVIEIVVLLWLLRELLRSAKPFLLSFNPL